MKSLQKKRHLHPEGPARKVRCYPMVRNFLLLDFLVGVLTLEEVLVHLLLLDFLVGVLTL